MTSLVIGSIVLKRFGSLLIERAATERHFSAFPASPAGARKPQLRFVEQPPAWVTVFGLFGRYAIHCFRCSASVHACRVQRWYAKVGRAAR